MSYLEEQNKTSDSELKNSMDQFRGLPKYLEQVSQNIRDIDTKINNKETSNSQRNKIIVDKSKVVNNNSIQEFFDLKNIVKQSVEGLNHIFDGKIGNTNIILNENKINIASNKILKTSKEMEFIKEEESPTVTIQVKTKKVINKENVVNSNINIMNKKNKLTTSTSINNTNQNKKIKSKVIYESPSAVIDNNNSSQIKDSSIISTVNISANIPESLKNKSSNKTNNINPNNVKKKVKNIIPNNIEKLEKDNSLTSSQSLSVKEKLNKNIVKLKDKITNMNFVKDNLHVEADLIVMNKEKKIKKEEDINSIKSLKEKENNSNISNIIPVKNNPVITNIPLSKRSQSINKRYDNKIDKDHSYKSKSPISINKNYQFKPKSKKSEISNFNNLAEIDISYSNNSNKKLITSYMTEGKNVNTSLLTKKSSKKIIANIRNSARNLNKEEINEIPQLKKNRDFSFDHHPLIRTNEVGINSFIQMMLIFNQIKFSDNKDYNSKLTSEDMNKLLTSLLDNNNNDDSNSVNVNRSFEMNNLNNFNTFNNDINKNDLQHIRDKKKISILYKNLDVKKITKIQRNWRNHKIYEIMNTKDENKINEEIQKNILETLSKNESIKKIQSLMITSINLFDSLMKNNKSKIIFKFIYLF